MWTTQPAQFYREHKMHEESERRFVVNKTYDEIRVGDFASLTRLELAGRVERLPGGLFRQLAVP